MKIRMLKIEKIFFVLAVLVLPLGAQSRIIREQVVPGVWHEAVYDSTGPWSIHVLKIDLTNPDISITSTTAEDQLGGTERTSVQAKRMQDGGETVVAAINADFFKADGRPVGLHVINGIPLNQPSEHTVFELTVDKTPRLARLSFSGQILWPSGKNMN